MLYDFNTSNVKVKQEIKTIIVNNNDDFNTSNVKVKR